MNEKTQPKSRRPSVENTNAILEAIEKGILIPEPETGEIKLRSGKKINERLSFFGYRRVTFRLGDTIYSAYVHKIIWLSKHKRITTDSEIDHIDSNKQNCRISNLQELHWRKNIQKGQLQKKEIFGAF